MWTDDVVLWRAGSEWIGSETRKRRIGADPAEQDADDKRRQLATLIAEERGEPDRAVEIDEMLKDAMERAQLVTWKAAREHTSILEECLRGLVAGAGPR